MIYKKSILNRESYNLMISKVYISFVCGVLIFHSILHLPEIVIELYFVQNLEQKNKRSKQALNINLHIFIYYLKFLIYIFKK